MPSSVFIRGMHPKTEVRPDPATIRRILDNDWWGQLKIHGHRAQIHISADPDAEALVYTRSGKLHERSLSKEMVNELRRILQPMSGYTVVEGEWLKPEDKLFLFDYLKKDGKLLDQLSYEERWQLLPKLYISPRVETLGVLKTVDECLNALRRPEEWVEGIVLKARKSKGFFDRSIIRCRKEDRRF